MKVKILLSLFLIIPSISNAAEYNYVNYHLILPQFLSTPRAAGSDEAKEEAKYIIKLQDEASLEEIQMAGNEATLSPELMDINKDKYPKTYAILQKSFEDCRSAFRENKDYWNTDRPYKTDNRIRPLARITLSGSYPSGHTACTRLWAEILGQLSPSKLKDFRARAAQIANHRVLVGMHWPHDIKGGEQLAYLLLGALQTSSAYQRDLADAKPEWK